MPAFGFFHANTDRAVYDKIQPISYIARSNNGGLGWIFFYMAKT